MEVFLKEVWLMVVFLMEAFIMEAFLTPTSPKVPSHSGPINNLELFPLGDSSVIMGRRDPTMELLHSPTLINKSIINLLPTRLLEVT